MRAAQPRASLVLPVAAFLAALIVFLLTGCEVFQPRTAAPAPPPPRTSTTPTPTTSKPSVARSPSSYNLTGYSAAFKQGYADACASPRRRDAERFKSDTDYSMGWNDGSSLCRGR